MDSQLGKGWTWQADTTIEGLVPEAMKPIGRATGSDHRGRERVLRHSARTARNRRTRTRMYGGVGGGAPAEMETFAGIYPNANFMISHDLLTQNPTPDHGALVARDAESFRVVQE